MLFMSEESARGAVTYGFQRTYLHALIINFRRHIKIIPTLKGASHWSEKIPVRLAYIVVVPILETIWYAITV